ncbi:MAG: DMT family transporter [Actinobacteria bacterium]|nr:DMT family transporter [Actinomycetota bacterium]
MKPVDHGRDHGRGLLCVAGAAIIWGSTPLFARWSGAGPFVTVFWRVVFGSLALLIYVVATGQLRLLRGLSRRTILTLLFLGLLLACGWATLFTAFAWTTVATAILLNYIGPLFVAVFTPLATGASADRRIVLPLGLAIVGTAVIVGPQAFDVAGSRNLFGIIMALVSAGIYAMTVLVNKRVLVGVPPGLAAFVQQVTAAVVLLPVVFFLPGPDGLTGWGSVVTLGVVNAGLAMLLFYKGLRLARTDRVAVLSYIEPLAAVTLAAIFLAEPLTWYTGLGGAAVLAGGIMVARLGDTPVPRSS